MRKLQIGASLLLSDGACAIIEQIQIEQLSKPETTYNFEVEDFHTYYVGAGVLVHNRKACDLEIYDSLEDSPYYNKDFISDGDPTVVGIKDIGLEKKLNSRFPGDWKKVYDYGILNGSYAEYHYFGRQVGYKTFDKFFLVKRKL